MSVRSRPTSVLSVTLPAAPQQHLAGGGGELEDDWGARGGRAASTMHVAEGYLAVATHDAAAGPDASDASDAALQFPPPAPATLSVYALRCDPSGRALPKYFL